MVDFILFVKSEGKGEDIVFLVIWTSVVEYILCWYALPMEEGRTRGETVHMVWGGDCVWCVVVSVWWCEAVTVWCVMCGGDCVETADQVGLDVDFTRGLIPSL